MAVCNGGENKWLKYNNLQTIDAIIGFIYFQYSSRQERMRFIILMATTMVYRTMCVNLYRLLFS